jgi:hypothetical protein
MSKEKWIEEILQSAKQVNPVPANPYMATRIEAKLKENMVPVTIFPMRWVYASAAMMLLLLAMNISIWRSNRQASSPPGVQQLIQEYGWGNTDLYSVNLSNNRP